MGITSVSTSAILLLDCSVPFYISAMKEILYKRFEAAQKITARIKNKCLQKELCLVQCVLGGSHHLACC